MSRFPVDRVLALALCLTALVSAGLVLLIVVFVAAESAPALQQLGFHRFLHDPSWSPTNPAGGQFNILPMLLGSLLVTAGSVLVAGPAGIVSALFTCYYAPRPVASAYRRLLELLAGIPSVVFGLWGLTQLVPLVNKVQPPGQSLLAGILVVSLMVLPTVALTAEAACRSVSPDQLRGAAALGLGRWATISGVVWPAARSGVLAGILLALTRVLGETMAVVMVCGNVVAAPGSLFDPVRTITANIALEMGYASSAHRAALFLSGLLLIVTIALVLGAVELLRRARSQA